jgi:uncharacterized phage protein gp47/JayE
MAFTPRTRAEIRSSILSYWNSRYLATKGTPLLTVQGSDAYMEADAIALVLEGYDARASAAVDEIFPDTASDDGVLHHAAVDGIDREAAVSAILEIEISGTPSATVTFGTSMLQTAGGVQYSVSASPTSSVGSVALDGSGDATVYGTCLTAGTDGNQEALTTLTWSATPADASATATVVDTYTTGNDQEDVDDLAARVIARRRERPGAGNRADWRAWCEAVSEVSEAYVYPLLHPLHGAGTLGAVTVVVLGEAPDDPTDLTPSRVLDSSIEAIVEGYIEGDNDETGTVVADGEQLRPTTMMPVDYSVEVCTTTTQDVELQITLGSGFEFPFSGTYVCDIGCSVDNLNTTTDPSGVVSVGDYIAVESGDPDVRGGYEIVLVDDVTGFSLGLATPLLAAPPAGRIVRPAPTNWGSMRDAVLEVFDRLGPGDTSPATRYPTPQELGPPVLYPNSLAAAVMGVPGLPGAAAGVSGVLDATCVTPAAAVTPAAKALIIPNNIIFTE